MGCERKRDVYCLVIARNSGTEKRVFGVQGRETERVHIKCLDNFSRTGTKVFACGSGERGKEVASSLDGVGKF